nr:PREDICTED: uncharacterized protein LOC105663895 [Megachile rotundata]
MHQSNGQVERYCRTVLNMIRVEANFRQEAWSDVLWKIQLTLNLTKQKSTQYSPLNLLTGNEAVTPIIPSIVRDVALEGKSPNRESLRNRYVNLPVNQDVVFVPKSNQLTGKLDSGMKGPYKVMRALPHDRYELKLLAGSYGKVTQAAAAYMTLWHGEWTPEVCTSFFECDNEDPKDGVVAGPSNYTYNSLIQPEEEAGEDAPQSGEAVLA